MTLHIGAIADDLTGATDLALMLAQGGLRVIQVIGVPQSREDLGDAEAVVVALKSRNSPVAEAIAQSEASAKVLLEAGAQQLLFKYCSTFDSTDDGNIGPVTDALMSLLGETRTIACPAFPGNGRRIFRGHLFVGDALLSDSSMKDHPLTPMRDSNLVRVLQRQTDRAVSLIPHEVVAAGDAALSAAIDRVEGIAIVDAISDADLRTIGRAVRSLRLVTGASGVALGLPANFRPGAEGAGSRSISAAPGRRAILAGSCSAATRRQIGRAEAEGYPTLRVDALEIADGRQSVAEAVEFAVRAPEGTAPLIYSSAEPEVVAATQGRLGQLRAGEIVEDFFAQVARRLVDHGVTRLIVAGGETSGAVVGALGVSSLLIGPEIDPGVPWTMAKFDGKPIALALKSGNFGADDFFVKAWDLIG